jgi:hypothetical protein
MIEETISCSFRLPRSIYEKLRLDAEVNKRSMAKQLEYRVERDFRLHPMDAELTEHAYEAQ